MLKKENSIRVLFALFALALLAIATIITYRQSTSTTDENWFVGSTANVSIIKNIDILNGSKEFAAIQKGDLLVGLNSITVPTLEQAENLIRDSKKDTLSLKVLRPEMNKVFKVTVKKNALPDSFLMALPDFVFVTSVLPGGASDRAGMKPGDLITKIRGQTFKDSQDADRILRSNKAGTTVEYEIIRGTETKILYVTLSIFGIFFANLIAILVGLFFFGTALLMVMQSPHQKALRILSAAMLICGLLIIIFFMQREPQFDIFSIMRINVNIIAPVFALMFWFHSFFYFPQKLEIGNIKNKVLAFLYILAVLNIINVIAWDIFKYNINILSILQQFYFLSFVIIAIYLRIKYRSKFTKEYRALYKPIKYFGIGTLVLEALLIFTITRGVVTQQVLGYATLPLILIPFGYLYAIGRYNLFDMNIRLKRNIQYTIVSIGWNAFIILGTLFLLIRLAYFDLPTPNITFSSSSIEILDKEISLKETIVINRIIFILLTSVIVYISWRVMRIGQYFINRKFYQSKLDYRRSTTLLNDVIYKNPDIRDLIKTISAELIDLISLKSIGIIVFEEKDAHPFHHVINVESEKWQECIDTCSSQLINGMQEYSDPLILGSSSEALFTKIKENGFEILVPVRSSKNRLIGLILLGQKQSESPFHNDDLDFIAAASRQVSFAIENSFLYTEIAVQERLKMELDIARNIQMSSLPQSLPDIGGLDVAGISIPALEVGGDYFDYLNGKEDALTVIIGDVSGKGTSSALYMSKIQGIMRSLHSFDLSPSDLFIRANQILRKDVNRKYFITAIAGSFDIKNKSLQLARAGHLPLYFYQKSQNAVHKLTPSGIGFGLTDTQVFAREIQLLNVNYESGDIFVFATDGVTEAFDSKGNEYGENQLSECLLKNSAKSATEICKILIENVMEFSNNQQNDDITVVIVKIS